MEGGSTISWRENIINQIQNRNKEQLFKFQDLITSRTLLNNCKSVHTSFYSIIQGHHNLS